MTIFNMTLHQFYKLRKFIDPASVLSMFALLLIFVIICTFLSGNKSMQIFYNLFICISVGDQIIKGLLTIKGDVMVMTIYGSWKYNYLCK